MLRESGAHAAGQLASVCWRHRERTAEQRRMRRCTGTEILTGRWVLVNGTIAPYRTEDAEPSAYLTKYARLPDHTSAASWYGASPWNYHWQPSTRCRFDQFDLRSFCTALDDSSMTFVGDSVIFQAYRSLALLAGAERTHFEAGRSNYGRVSLNVCAGRSSAITFVRVNEWPSPTKNPVGHALLRQLANGSGGGGRNAVIVWSVSAVHAIRNNWTDAQYSQVVRHWSSIFRGPMIRASWYQVSIPGASGCGCSTSPLEETWAPGCEQPSASKYCQQWSKIPVLNQVAKIALGDQHLQVIDVEDAFALRPDARRGSACELLAMRAARDSCTDHTAKACSGRSTTEFVCRETDCYHLHMPGAVDLLPRIYLQNLINQLQ